MQRKHYFYIGIIILLVIALLSVLVIIYNSNNYITTPEVQLKPSTLIFKLKSDYSGNYLGPITHNKGTNTYFSSYTMELFDYCYMTSKSNDVYDDITGEKVHDGMDSEEEICFNMDSDKQLQQGGVKKLQEDYYAIKYPASEVMVKRFAVLDKSIITKTIRESDRLSVVPATFPNGIKPGMGDSMKIPREEFYDYIIDENPLIEAYFCDEPENNLNVVAIDLSNGEIPNTCNQIV